MTHYYIPRTARPICRHVRSGFTLIELLVVIFLIGVLVGLFVLFMPGFNQTERSAQGASNVYLWCANARQTALRDQSPRGVRLIPDPANPQFFIQGQYLAQPDDFTGGALITAPDPPPGVPPAQVLRYAGVDLTGGFYSSPNLWPIQNGDFIQLHNSGLMHQIATFNGTNPSTPWIIPDAPDAITGLTTSGRIILASPLPYAINIPQPNYKIVRQPRLQGDAPMDLPQGVAIDVTANATYGVPLPPLNPDGSIDIVFSPTGSVMGSAGVDKMVFWVRETSLPFTDAKGQFTGNPALVAVYLQSGLVAGYPVDLTNPANPFSKVK